MLRFRSLSIPGRFLLSACALMATLAPSVAPPGAAAARPAWPLPGVGAGVTVGDQDFVTNFRRAALVQLERQGGFSRSSDPAHPAHLVQGMLLTVQEVSPSARVPFASQAFFGRLEYVPLASAGLAPLVQPSSAFVRSYCLPATGAGRCAQVGRATGIIARLTPDSIRSQARGFTRARDRDDQGAYGGAVTIRPPGYLTGAGLTQAGHLLGYELGGPRTEPRNFVTQLNLANAPAQSSLENAIKNALTAATPGGTTPAGGSVLVRVIPLYQGACVVPYAVRYEAVGANGWQLPTAATGVAAQWLTFERGPDDVVAASIRNALRVGKGWQVPGQDAQATCVPAGYTG